MRTLINDVSVHDLPTQGSSFQLLTSVQTVTELEKTDIVLCDLINEMPTCAKLTKCKLVVVLVIQNVH